jgi:hypothetical protein
VPTLNHTDSDVRMTFGRHRGRPLRDVPTKYLNWLREQSLAGTLPLAVLAELRRRAARAADAPEDARLAGPPPVVAVNREGCLAELSFFLAEGERLDEGRLALVGWMMEATTRAPLPDGMTRCVLCGVAGFGVVPADEADDLAARLRALLTRRARR